MVETWKQTSKPSILKYLTLALGYMAVQVLPIYGEDFLQDCSKGGVHGIILKPDRWPANVNASNCHVQSTKTIIMF